LFGLWLWTYAVVRELYADGVLMILVLFLDDVWWMNGFIFG
jgi:hypothetical protein